MRVLEDWRLLRFDPFAGDKDDAGARNQTSRVVTTRKAHECLMSPDGAHEMPAGTKAVVYQAIFDNKWRRFYLCAACISKEEIECGAQE